MSPPPPPVPDPPPEGGSSGNRRREIPARGPARGPAAIARRLPHRHPFLLLDRVEEISPGKNGRGIKVISAGELVGPGQAMPSLLILEAGAQLLGLVAAEGGEDSEGAGEGAEGAVGYLAAVEGFTVHRRVRAGDRLEIEVTLGRRFGPLLQGEIRARVDTRLAAEGRLTAISGQATERGAPGH